jgi:hypothetical protein
LKSSSLDPLSLENYRPISNLQFMSKLLERVAAKRLQQYLEVNQLLNHHQSAYRRFSSTETAMTLIIDEIARNSDAKKLSVLILLDMSAAFDTVCHSMLIHRFQNIGINAAALDWLTSYLRARSQFVSVNGLNSRSTSVTMGVPQGSVLGPILFNIYMTPVADLLQKEGVVFQIYADDIQFVYSCEIHEAQDAWLKISTIVNNIADWAMQNSLKINEAKTKAIAFGPKSWDRKLLELPPLQLKTAKVSIELDGKSLGVVLDSSLSMDAFVSATCRSSFAALNSIRRVRNYLDHSSLHMLVHSFVISRMHHCISLLLSLPQKTTARLQRVMNAAARLLTTTPRFSHISPVLNELRWLNVPHRVMYRALLTAHSIIHFGIPKSLIGLIQIYIPNRCLRSADTNRLLTLPSRTLVGQRAFSRSIPSLWNDLPVDLRLLVDTRQFRSQLFHHLLMKQIGT